MRGVERAISRLIAVLVALFAVSAVSVEAGDYSMFNNKLNFPKGMKLYSFSASYVDGLIIPEPWTFKIPTFKYRYEIAFASLRDGQAGSFGIGYAAGLGMLKKEETEVRTEERLVGRVLAPDGNWIETYEVTETEYVTETKTVRATAEISLSYHRPIGDYADVYARVHGGFVPTAGQIVDNPQTKDYITYGGVVGIQYMIKGKFGFFAEAGAGEQVFTAGIVWGSMNSAFMQVISSFFGSF